MVNENRTYSHELGQRLNETYSKFGSKAAAARAAGVTTETFSSWIAGGPKVPIQGLQSYSACGDIDFIWLCTGVDTNKVNKHILSDDFINLVADAFEQLESLLKRLQRSIPDSRYKIKLAIALAEEAYEDQEKVININQHLKVIEAIAS
jgi:hypothetical protein